MSERDYFLDFQAADDTKKPPSVQSPMPAEQSDSDLSTWTADEWEQSVDEETELEDSDQSHELSSQGSAEEDHLPDQSVLSVEGPHNSKETLDKTAAEREELRQIAAKSRKLRILFQLSQDTLAKSLNQLTYRKYSNVTISNFEQNRLTLAKMREVRLAIEPWFRQLDAAFGQGRTVDEFVAEIASEHGHQPIASIRCSQKYKRVTPDQKLVLLTAFAERTHPKPDRYVQLGKQLGMDAKKVRNWFTNQRQLVRRLSSKSKSKVGKPGCSRKS